MTKLHQLIPVERNVKAVAETTVTKAYHISQKTDLFSGLLKTYEPLEEDGLQLPGERKIVQATVPQVIADVSKAFTRLFDITITKDETNAQAVANVVVDGVVLVEDAPVSTLLWLEKKLLDLRAIVSKLPVLDPAKVWTYDTSIGLYRADPVETMRSKKVIENIVVVPATDKHPAQWTQQPKDVPEGKWTNVELSGAIPQSRKDELAARVEKLSEAVKTAREGANSRDVIDAKMGESLLGYVFA